MAPVWQPGWPARSAAFRTGCTWSAHELRGNGPVVRYARCCLQQADRRSWAAALEVIAGCDGSDRLAAISVPVMLVAAMAQPGPAPGCLMH
jgi:hypothetical protein